MVMWVTVMHQGQVLRPTSFGVGPVFVGVLLNGESLESLQSKPG